MAEENCWEILLDILKKEDYLKDEGFSFWVLRKAMMDLGIWKREWRNITKAEESRGKVVLTSSEAGMVITILVNKFEQRNKKMKKFGTEARRACGIVDKEKAEETGRLGKAW